MRVLQDKFSQYLKESDHVTLDVIANLSTIASVSEYDLIASHLPLATKVKQEILEMLDVEERVQKILVSL